MDRARSLPEILSSHAARFPSRRAFAFLRDGEQEVAALTFGELERAVQAASARLAVDASPGDRAVLLYPQGLDFLVTLLGCQRAGLVPVPVSQPNRQRGMDVLAAIVDNCDARMLLTTRGLADQYDEHLQGHERLCGLRRVCTDEWPVAESALPAPHAAAPGDIALLQYTSGSTGTPRGVVVTHANLVENQRAIERAFGHGASTVLVSWLPMFHDMGLGTVLQALWLGAPCTLMSPNAFLQKPVRWLRAIERCRATTSGGPDFAYDLCARKIGDEDVESLDLRSWRVAFSGAEPVRSASLARFDARFSACGFVDTAFHPVYGLAEATLLVTAPDPDAAPVVRRFDAEALAEGRAVAEAGGEHALVGCGGAWLDTRVEVVAPDTGIPVAAGTVGEIWVSGPGVAAGYWNRPDDTREAFAATLAGTEGPAFLRTGDLGFVDDGQLFVTGRLKDLVIIRGRNHYPQDIEATAGASHEALEPHGAAAFSIEADNAEQLVIVQEIKRTALKNADPGEIIRAIRAEVAERHGLHTYAIVLIKPATLPRTSSGKVRRRATRQAFGDKTLAEVASWVFWTEPPAAVEPEEAPTPAPAAPGDVEGLLDWVRHYAGRRINSRTIDERRTIPPYVVLDLGNRGLLGMQVPAESGGLGLSHHDTLRVLEQLGAVDLTVCLFVGLNNYLGIRPILRHASPEWRSRLLPRLATGRELAAFALTEPGAGSNPRAIGARAESDGAGRWRLHGTKVWSGAAQWAGVLNVFAAHVDTEGRRSGITAFAVPQGSHGLDQGAEALTMGMRGLIQNTVHLNAVPVEAAQVLGAIGAGMDVAHDAMMHARLAIGAAAIGAMKRCLQLGLRYASRRQINTGSLLAHPVTLSRIGRAVAATRALESLVFRVARAIDEGRDVPPEAFAAIKCLGPELLWRTVDDLAQLLGGRGYIETNVVPQLLRDARVLRVFEGPTETMAAFLGARLVSGGDALGRLLADVFGAPEAAARLEDARTRLLARLDAAGADSAGAVHLHHARAGELAAAAMLMAAAPDGVAATWAAAEFDRLLRRLDEADDGTWLTADEARAAVAGFETAIGDLEQALPFEDHGLDPLLRRDAAGQPSPAAAPAAAVPAGSDELRGWILDWLARRLKLPASHLASSRSFADHGLDSLASVEFVQELSQRLGRRLDDTLLWNFATPDALVRHLTEHAPRAAEEAPAPAADPQARVDEELARLERLLAERR